MEFGESTFPSAVSSTTNWHLFPSVNVPLDSSHVVSPSIMVESHELHAELHNACSHVSEVRRSQRSTKALLWMQDYVSSAHLTPSRPLYSIDKYLGYDYLSKSYHAFLSSFGHEVEPSTFEEACKDPRWVEAMQAEISALETHQTWKVVPLPPHKKAIGCK